VQLRQVVRALASQRVDAWLASVEPWPPMPHDAAAAPPAPHPPAAEHRQSIAATPAATAAPAAAAAPPPAAVAAAAPTAGDASSAAQQGSSPTSAAEPPPPPLQGGVPGADVDPVAAAVHAFGSVTPQDAESLRMLVVQTGEALRERDDDIMQNANGTTAPQSQQQMKQKQKQKLEPGAETAQQASEWRVSPPADDLGLKHMLTRTLAGLSCAGLCRVLLAMAQRFPRTLEVTISAVIATDELVKCTLPFDNRGQTVLGLIRNSCLYPRHLKCL